MNMALHSGLGFALLGALCMRQVTATANQECFKFSRKRLFKEKTLNQAPNQEREASVSVLVEEVEPETSGDRMGRDNLHSQVQPKNYAFQHLSF